MLPTCFPQLPSPTPLHKVKKSGSNTVPRGTHKRAGGWHNTINNDWLKTATQVENKPVHVCTPNPIGCLKPFQQYWIVQSVKSSTKSSRAARETSLSSMLPSRPPRTLNTAVCAVDCSQFRDLTVVPLCTKPDVDPWGIWPAIQKVDYTLLVIAAATVAVGKKYPVCCSNHMGKEVNGQTVTLLSFKR